MFNENYRLVHLLASRIGERIVCNLKTLKKSGENNYKVSNKSKKIEEKPGLVLEKRVQTWKSKKISW